MSLQAREIDFLEKNPQASMQDIVRNFPDENYSYLAKTKSNWKKGKLGKKKKKGKKSKKVKKSKPPHSLTSKTSRQGDKPGTSFDPRANMYKLANSSGTGAFQANRYILENKRYFSYESDIPPYKRPACFHPKQNEIVDAILDPHVKFVFVEGVQRGGKNTSILSGLHETVLTDPNKQWQFDIMVGKGKHAQRMLRNMGNDKILEKQNEALLSNVLNSYMLWFNGSRMDAHDTTVADIKGADCDIAWIDEFDVAIKKDPKACMSLMFTMRANKNMKGIFSANVDRGLFILLQDHFSKEALRTGRVKFFSIMNEDAPHAEGAGNDD